MQLKVGIEQCILSCFFFLIIMRPCLGLSGDVKDGAVSIASLQCMHAGMDGKLTGV